MSVRAVFVLTQSKRQFVSDATLTRCCWLHLPFTSISTRSCIMSACLQYSVVKYLVKSMRERKANFLVYCGWLKAVALNCLCIVQKSLHAIFCSSTNLQVLSPSKHSDYHKMHACTDGVGVYMKSSPLINMQMHIANCKNAFAAWLQDHATNTLLVTMPWDLGIVRSRASVYLLLPFPSYCQSFFILRIF